ncbi:type II toxin-antitoxin system RelE/ParE family toxin [Candidatus Woesearchaeota archaeon]|nr:type II toxin-antitoxin system RelE/ParE family toxin [Candidatus Woesearchaeota archaeon]
MTFSINWHPKTQDFLRKSPKHIAIRISKKVRSIKDKPFHFLEHYEGENVYKLRIGDYRALIDVDFTEKVLFVLHLEHRKKVYK